MLVDRTMKLSHNHTGTTLPQYFRILMKFSIIIILIFIFFLLIAITPCGGTEALTDDSIPQNNSVKWVTHFSNYYENPPGLKYDNGLIFIPRHDQIVAVHENNGTIKWKHYMGYSSYKHLIVVDKTKPYLYFTSYGGNNKSWHRLYCVDQVTGELLWSFSDDSASTPSPHGKILTDGDELIVLGSGTLIKINKDSGEEINRYDKYSFVNGIRGFSYLLFHRNSNHSYKGRLECIDVSDLNQTWNIKFNYSDGIDHEGDHYDIERINDVKIIMKNECHYFLQFTFSIENSSTKLRFLSCGSLLNGSILWEKMLKTETIRVDVINETVSISEKSELTCYYINNGTERMNWSFPKWIDQFIINDNKYYIWCGNTIYVVNNTETVFTYQLTSGYSKFVVENTHIICIRKTRLVVLNNGLTLWEYDVGRYLSKPLFVNGCIYVHTAKDLLAFGSTNGNFNMNLFFIADAINPIYIYLDHPNETKSFSLLLLINNNCQFHQSNLTVKIAVYEGKSHENRTLLTESEIMISEDGLNNITISFNRSRGTINLFILAIPLNYTETDVSDDIYNQDVFVAYFDDTYPNDDDYLYRTT